MGNVRAIERKRGREEITHTWRSRRGLGLEVAGARAREAAAFKNDVPAYLGEVLPLAPPVECNDEAYTRPEEKEPTEEREEEGEEK